MVENADNIELFERELDLLLNKAARSGLNACCQLRLIMKAAGSLAMKIETELWLKEKS